MADFIAKSDFQDPCQSKRSFFFGGLLARGLRNRFREDFGTDLGIDLGEFLPIEKALRLDAADLNSQ